MKKEPKNNYQRNPEGFSSKQIKEVNKQMLDFQKNEKERLNRMKKIIWKG